MSAVTKPPSTATAPVVQESEVTSFLYIKPSRTSSGKAQSLEKEAVLRRIRHKRRVDRLRNALSSFLTKMPEPPREMIKDGELVVDDAFSCP